MRSQPKKERWKFFHPHRDLNQGPLDLKASVLPMSFSDLEKLGLTVLKKTNPLITINLITILRSSLPFPAVMSLVVFFNIIGISKNLLLVSSRGGLEVERTTRFKHSPCSTSVDWIPLGAKNIYGTVIDPLYIISP